MTASKEAGVDIFDDIAKSWLSLNSSVYIISTVENRQKLQDSLAQHFRLGVAAGASQDPAAGERELPDEVKKHRAEYPKEASDRNFSRKATAEDLVLLILWELWDCILEPNGVPGMYPCTAKSAAILPLLAAERGKLERVRKLSEKWRAETESYPHTDRGLAAHRAVRLCASELDAVLSVTRPEPAEASSGKP
jgi:hypothetical protein